MEVMLDTLISRCFLIIILTATSRSESTYQLCSTNAQCGKDQCCAMKGLNRLAFCMPAKQLGDQCVPNYLYGSSYTCGCKQGLTCALVEKNRSTLKEKHRCVKVLPEAEEIVEGSNKSPTKDRFTATELSRLLKLINNKARIRKV
ncbi:prokineticin Bm8-f-like isoform X2 [Hydractinia symbiolongicarpus]|uniref:prokineticin Bm8-f-like isoform X2 n=1 Tax=Hydractinia symbiolongicarpus TaxID=13093 RepID=UPI00254E3146|nr:prokineticin Bm8-f-like isoform X2 [Hydractinia symbiolongicarpus]